ncbi:phosphate-starvation-inducible PsiE family protein [Sulfobacillus harzensis]|uniref:Uncharacterized protein n=1 Tax=Sulfobacillus harzensis TaxID=2729629 RepID=A0A7Y0L8Q3_9FIRM|nr:hypothetical protein [Sulfobacillus harzensis]
MGPINVLTTRIRHTINRLIEWGVSTLYLLTVLFVLAFAAVLARHLMQGLFRAGDPRALLRLLDPLLMLMMLAELLHTIALTLRTRHLPLRPLLALVFIAVLEIVPNFVEFAVSDSCPCLVE